MEIKMCTCPNGHYYNADIYSSCPECGASAGAQPMGSPAGAQPIGATAPAGGFTPPVGANPPMGNFQEIGKTMPIGGAQPMGGGNFGGAQPIGATEPVNNFGAPQGIGKTMPIGGSSFGGVGVTAPVNNRNIPGGGPATPFSVPTQSASDLGRGVSEGEPVVGWLVCIEGPMRGMDFRLHDGYNFIGREEGDIHVRGDNAISRSKHAVIAFYARRNTFHVGPADGRNIIELNDAPVFNHTEMKSYDVITVGNTKLMLITLCGDRFSWTAGVNNGR